MVRYQADLKNFSFQAIRKHYPSTQRRVYDTLLEMTPERLQFELAAIPNREDYKFCQEGLDTDTYAIIGTIMSVLLDEKNLLLTKDDIIISYLRFRELVFLYEAVRQGIMVTQLTDTGVDYFFNVGSVELDNKQPTIKLYQKSILRYKQSCQ
jgi:hypothetical protein